MKFLWIFDPDAVLTLLPICALLWALGGSGVKWLRGWGIPVVVSLAAVSFGAPWWLGFLNFGVMNLTLRIPYGDDIHAVIGEADGLWSAYLFFAGLMYGASLGTLCIHFGNWQTVPYGAGLCGFAFSGVTILSQKYKRLVWKVCEMLTGLVIGFISFRIIGG